MRAAPILAAVLLVSAPAGELTAQFSANLPGVPRASLPFHGGSQGRFEFDLTGFKLASEPGDTLGGRLRLGFGRSWRIASSFEFGFDVTLAEGTVLRSPQDSTAADPESQLNINGSAAYGLRFGLKFRPISYVDPSGYGFEAAVGVGYQPTLEPAFIYRKMGDSTFAGGAIGKDDDDLEKTKIHASTQFLLALGYTTPRLTADVALLVETATLDGSSPVVVYDGVSPRLGLKYRLTGGFAVGVAYWGSGAPPWRDRLAGSVGPMNVQQFGILLGFGSRPGKGTDLIISSPTGAFGEALNLYWRIW